MSLSQQLKVIILKNYLLKNNLKCIDSLRSFEISVGFSDLFDTPRVKIISIETTNNVYTIGPCTFSDKCYIGDSFSYTFRDVLGRIYGGNYLSDNFNKTWTILK